MIRHYVTGSDRFLSVYLNGPMVRYATGFAGDWTIKVKPLWNHTVSDTAPSMPKGVFSALQKIHLPKSDRVSANGLSIVAREASDGVFGKGWVTQLETCLQEGRDHTWLKETPKAPKLDPTPKEATEHVDLSGLYRCRECNRTTRGLNLLGVCPDTGTASIPSCPHCDGTVTKSREPGPAEPFTPVRDDLPPRRIR